MLLFLKIYSQNIAAVRSYLFCLSILATLLEISITGHPQSFYIGGQTSCFLALKVQLGIYLADP